MKYGKLTVSIAAAALMGCFAPAFAGGTYSQSSESSVGMRNTDANSPQVVQQESPASQPSLSSGSDIESSVSGSGGSEMAAPSSEPNSVTTLPDGTASSDPEVISSWVASSPSEIGEESSASSSMTTLPDQTAAADGRFFEERERALEQERN
jgi:hypothetical protein